MKTLRLLFLVGLATGFISDKLLVHSQSPSVTADDLYLEGKTSGDLPVDDEDRENSGSGSGSGDYVFSNKIGDEVTPRRFLKVSETTVSKEMVTVAPQPAEDTATTPFRFPKNNKKEVLDMSLTASHTPYSASSTSMPPSKTTAAEASTDISVTNSADKNNNVNGWDDSTAKDGGETVLIKKGLNHAGQENAIFVPDSPEQVTSESLWEKTEVLAAVIACVVVGFLCAVFLLILLAYRMKKKDEGSYDLGDTKLSTTAYHKTPTKEFYA